LLAVLAGVVVAGAFVAMSIAFVPAAALVS
jgi:hypothetical protein